jgi:hypothetical protein
VIPRPSADYFVVGRRQKPNFQNEFFKLFTFGRPPQGLPEYPQQF